jgi:hypothetical protein
MFDSFTASPRKPLPVLLQSYGIEPSITRPPAISKHGPRTTITSTATARGLGLYAIVHASTEELAFTPETDIVLLRFATTDLERPLAVAIDPAEYIEPADRDWRYAVAEQSVSKFRLYADISARIASLQELNLHPNLSVVTENRPPDVGTTSATTLPGATSLSEALQARVKQIVRGALQEWFEPGMESTLSREVTGLLFAHSAACIVALTPYLLEGKPINEVAAQIAITLGRIRHQATRSERLTLLLQLVESPSFILRDAALTGLSYANDRSVVPTLEAIAARTTDAELKRDIGLTVADLNS